MTDPFDTRDWWGDHDFLAGLHTLLDPVRVPFVLDALGASPRRVLDVGCGGGFLVSAIAAHGHHVTGIDSSTRALSAARRAAPRAHLAAGDALRLPIADGTFGAVVMSEVLEHVADPRRAVEEAARTLMPGGVLVVTGPNRTTLSRIALISFAQNWPTAVLPRDLHVHRRFVTPQELASWGSAAGLRPGTVVGVGIRPADVPRAVTAYLSLRLGRATFAAAGQRIRLTRTRRQPIAYMTSLTKLQSETSPA